jgi:hypothetical protein
MPTRLAYSTRCRRQDAPLEALVIHCGDHRFQTSFREFLTEHLGLASYALLAVPGGAHFVPFPHIMPKFVDAGMRSLSFHIKNGKPRKLVLIGHDDCVFFKQRLQFFLEQPLMREKQLANLKLSRSALVQRFPGLPVELYYADSQPDGSIQFLSVD